MLKGVNINDCAHSFETGNIQENKELRNRNVDALNAKYPGLFTK
jgi:hypothetical protein